MDKKFIVFAGPVTTRSGYGARSRDICHSILDLGHELKIVATAWGTTPLNALSPSNEKDLRLLNSLASEANPIDRQPEIYIQCSIPNEFNPMGQFNIGLTAGIETDACSHDWIEGCNRMDLILTSSTHSKNVFEKTQYQKRDKRTDAVESIIKCETPVEVLFEGVDINTYFKTDLAPNLTTETLDIPEDFAFLFVGHWLQGTFGEDRKNVALMIHTFIDTFISLPPDMRPALVLKASKAGFSVTERLFMEKDIHRIYKQFRRKGVTGKLPSIYLLFGEMSDAEMNNLYNHPKVKAMISFTKGEGFGRPLLEFTTTGKPLIASNWSGHTDFLNPKHSFLLAGSLNEVHPSSVNKWIIPQAKWFQINISAAKIALMKCFTSYKEHVTKSEGHIKHTLENFTMSQMKDKLQSYFDDIPKYIVEKSKFSKPVMKPLNIPSTINLPKLKEIKNG